MSLSVRLSLLKLSLRKMLKLLLQLITSYDLPREALPTTLLNSVDVWEALNANMPMTATIRNLGKMTNIGLLKSNLDANTKLVCERIT